MANYSITLDDVNRAEVYRQIPLATFLTVISIFGLVGNTFVFRIYKANYGPSNSRTFIIFLSVIDLFSCGLVIPFEILTTLRNYKFQHESLCKINVFMNMWVTLISSSMLLVISIDRYRKICRPFYWQISSKNSKRICVAVVFVAAACSWSAPAIYGIYKSKHNVYTHIMLSECAVTAEMRKRYLPLVNNISFGIIFVGALSAITVMYCLLGLGIREYNKRQAAFEIRKSNNTSLETLGGSETVIRNGQRVLNKTKVSKPKQYESENDTPFYSEHSVKQNINENATSFEMENCLPQVKCTVQDENGMPTEITSETVPKRLSVLNSVQSTEKSGIFLSSNTASAMSSAASSNTDLNRSRDKKINSQQSKSHRTALIMFVISLVFMLNYLPMLSLLLIRSVSSDYLESFSDVSRTAYKFFLRSYFLSYALNPLIYAWWDAKFRKTVKRALCCCCNNK